MTTSPPLPTGTWTLDAATSTITVSVKKLGMITVPATLTVTSGTIEIDDDHRVVSVDISADAGSYASKNAKRNAHVVGSDFLDADTHPSIRFEASNVTPGPSGYSASGTVTVKGKRSPIDVTISDVAVTGTNGSFRATATVDRTAIGVDKLPTFIVGRDLQITVAANATA